MQFLTSAQCLQYCSSRGQKIAHAVSFRDVCDYCSLESPFSVKYGVPIDSGIKVAFSRSLIFHFGFNQEMLLWLNNWSVWPSSGHRPLYNRFRTALGSINALEEAPGHLVVSDDVEDAISILVMAMEFYWDCLILPGGSSSAFFLSHDEYMCFTTFNDNELKSFNSLISKFDLNK